MDVKHRVIFLPIALIETMFAQANNVVTNEKHCYFRNGHRVAKNSRI